MNASNSCNLPLPALISAETVAGGKVVGMGRCRRYLGFYENMDGPCHVCMHEPMKIFHVTMGGQLPNEGQDP